MTSVTRHFIVAASILATFVGNPTAISQTVVADWTFSQGSPNDAVGGHNFETSVGTPPNSYGSSSIGGPTVNPAFFDGSGGYEQVAVGTSTLPTNNFTLSLYTMVPAADLNQTGIIFSTDGNGDGNFQIAITGGNFVAYFNDASHLDAERFGSFAATDANTHLAITDIGGILTFTDNGVNQNDPLSSIDEPASFADPYVGIAPNGPGFDFTGYVSDITVTSGVTAVPEPSVSLVTGIAIIGLVIARRFRRSWLFGWR